MHTTLYRCWHDDCRDECLKINQSFTTATLSIHLPISDTQPSKKLYRTSAPITWRNLPWVSSARWTWRLLSLPSLNRCLFIHTDYPKTLRQQILCLSVKLQHRPCPDQKSRWLHNMLPAVIPPRLNLVRCQPTPHCAGRNVRDLPQRNHLLRKFCITPVRQCLTNGLRSAASQRGCLRSDLRGKNGAGHPVVVGRQRYAVPSTSDANSVPSDPCNSSLVQSVGCSTQGGHELLTKYEHATPALEATCGHELYVVAAALLLLLIQSYTWVWVHACRTSALKYTSNLPLPKPGTYLRNAVLSESLFDKSSFQCRR